MKRKHKVFTSLSRRRRRARTQHIKNLIHAERARCGGLFYDDCDFTNAEAIAQGWEWKWSDILFLGNTPDVYWNADIVTIELEQLDIAEDMAFAEARALVSEEERAAELRFKTKPVLDGKGKVIAHEMVRKPDVRYPKLGGLSYFEFVNKRQLEIVRDIPPVVTPGYRIRPGYRAGIGLQIIVAEPVLTCEIINTAINSFLAGNMPAIVK